MKPTSILKIATILAASSVLMGAFGAHSLVQYVSEKAVDSFQRAVYYQFIHAFALISFSVLLLVVEHPQKTVIPTILRNMTVWLFYAGIIGFSGSIYYITIQKILHGEQVQIATWIRLVTPLGGLCFVFAWLTFFCSIFYIKIEKSNP